METSITACLQAVYSQMQQLQAEARAISRFAALDFTPFRFMSHGEVPTTHLLAYFLNAEEQHGQGDLFLQLFIEQLYQHDKVHKIPRLPGGKWWVQAEKRQPIVGQIDLLLVHESKKFALCIENKPRDTTSDQDKQLTRYQQYIEQHPQSLLLYLSRTTRLPGEHSITAGELQKLEDGGRYLNITYQDFLLPLLDVWREQTQPEAVRLFIRQFRYHLEAWLNLGNTKPFTLMQDETIAQFLTQSTDRIAAALQIASSVDRMQALLFNKFTVEFTNRFQRRAPDLAGACHWAWSGFTGAEGGEPFLIRPEPVIDVNGQAYYPWGRYTVAVEWTSGTELCYGIRFDVKQQDRADLQTAHWSEAVKAELFKSGQMPEPGKTVADWWPWYAQIDLANKEATNIRWATGELLDDLTEKLDNLITVMRQLAATGLLTAPPATTV